MTPDENAKIPMLEPYTVKKVIGALSETEDYNHRMLGVPEMWKKTKGRGAKVVVLDTGCPRHVDLNVSGFRNFTDDESPYDEVCGHSTHVCGIIAALVNGIGVRGIAPECELYCGKVLDDSGTGSLTSIADGIRWAVDVVHADVINMSLGCPPVNAYSPTLVAACRHAYKNGCVMCCAAGNDAGAVNAPANLPTTIAVAAVDKDREKAYFTCHGSEVDFAAGGVDVYSTYLNNQYAELSGTSMATPVITGVVALVVAEAKAKGEKLTPEQVYQRLVSISVDVDQPGKDEYTGHGIPVFTSQAAVEPEKKSCCSEDSCESECGETNGFWAALARFIKSLFGRK
jgi:subtilisin